MWRQQSRRMGGTLSQPLLRSSTVPGISDVTDFRLLARLDDTYHTRRCTDSAIHKVRNFRLVFYFSRYILITYVCTKCVLTEPKHYRKSAHLYTYCKRLEKRVRFS